MWLRSFMGVLAAYHLIALPCVLALGPAHALSRVTSFDWFTSVGLMPLGYALVGPIADAVGLHATMFAATVIVAALAAGSLLLRRPALVRAAGAGGRLDLNGG